MSSFEKPSILHDGNFDIAIANSSKAIIWKNKEMLWSDLVKKLSKTHRTHETQIEYIKFKKDRQAEIKNIGGFVGGYLTSGRRTSANLMHRQLLTLDLDFATKDFINDIQLTFPNAFVIYSTHKHSPDNPRYRLIMPLTRPVRPDEYEAIARWIAGKIDIELFDPTTFQPIRLMYWPSSSSDAEYVFEFQDGPWIDADAILNTYVDWKGCNDWPASKKANDLIQRDAKKQGDPLDKPGLIGAFCRTYNIHEVIEEILNDVYEPCSIENLYTFKEGSTAAGLVVYDDKYAYSHHGTDPTSGKLCNAFDLVRIHKFGRLDEDSVVTASNKLPSFIAMQEFSATDKKVKKILGVELLQRARADFEGIESDDNEPVNDEWVTELDIDSKGKNLSTIANVAVILENDPRLKGRFATNTFLRRKEILKNLPWRNVTSDDNYLMDEDEQNLIKYLEKRYKIGNRANIKDAFDVHISASKIHPVKDFLQSLEWDGTQRIESLFIDYMGAEDCEYTRQVTRITLTAAVARIFKPGVKFDYVLTLIGPQGIGKSSIIAKLGGEWFSDSFNFNMLHTNQSFEQIQGVWIVELGELAGLKKADVEGAKHYISKTFDSYRPAYGRNVITYKRQCIFIGSGNNRTFLRDTTGGRRFWPVDALVQEPIKNVFTDFDNYEREQIWAEAVELYNKGEKLFLSKELEKDAHSRQADHSEEDEKAGIISEYLNTLLPQDWYDKNIYERRSYLSGDDLQEAGTIQRTHVCVAEIFCEALNGMARDMTQSNTKPIHDILRKLKGWKLGKRKRFKIYGSQTAYEFVKVDKEKSVTTGSKSVTTNGKNVTTELNGVSKNVTGVTRNVTAN